MMARKTSETMPRIPYEKKVTEPETMSIHRSFVVRVYTNRFDCKGISGQVEHIVSGEAAEFRSMEELLKFFGRLLSDQRRKLDAKESLGPD